MEYENSKIYKQAVIALAVGLFLLLITPWLFTREVIFDWLDFTQTGQIGDTIGGITAPFFALIGSFLVFLSFRAQIRMNAIQFRAIESQLERSKKEDENSQFERMQHVIDVIMNQYIDNYKAYFTSRRNSSGRPPFYPGEISRVLDSCNVNFSEENSRAILRMTTELTPLIHLKKLIENSTSEGEQLDFIKIQTQMLLEPLRIKVVGEHIRTKIDILLEKHNADKQIQLKLEFITKQIQKTEELYDICDIYNENLP